MGINLKLYAVQQALKAPKDQVNTFGKYNYRSCEGILEALKPHLGINQLVINLSDCMTEVGGRIYVKATATVLDVETGESVSATAYAREEEDKKGMDSSQITGAASSYARKYALNGLFAIDDQKDSDATNDGTLKSAETLAPKSAETKDVAKKETTDNKFRCEKCNEVLKPYTHNGKTVPIRQHAEKSRMQFGRVLCLDCINKIKEEQNA